LGARLPGTFPTVHAGVFVIAGALFLGRNGVRQTAHEVRNTNDDDDSDG
jgi:hypothetical protein